MYGNVVEKYIPAGYPMIYQYSSMKGACAKMLFPGFPGESQALFRGVLIMKFTAVVAEVSVGFCSRVSLVEILRR